MLNQLLTAAGIKRSIDQFPTQLLGNAGGFWEKRVLDVNAEDDELTLFNHDVPVAADILAPSATSRDVTEGPGILRLDRAYRLKQSSKLEHNDIKYMRKMSLLYAAAGELNEGESNSLATWLQQKLRFRLAGVAIRRGILKYGMAQGDFTYNQGGYSTTTDFGMVSAMRPTVSPWINTDGTIPGVNGGSGTAATPVTDLGNMQVTAFNLEGRRFNAYDMPRATFYALVSSAQFQTQARARIAFGPATALPDTTDPRMIDLAQSVLATADGPVTITLDDLVYQIENTDGTRSQANRYLNPNYVVLSNTGDYNNGTAYDNANVPITEGIIADAVGQGNVFNGADRGPVGYFSADQEEWSWMRSHATQECVPRRWFRTATARLTVSTGRV
jgi:hypothetical protein